uniref:exodeoxyribonuclease III n=1 Tax=Leptobrachium leishanense TaxID=445787 RepID=A0A8C5PV52_9ANUR
MTSLEPPTLKASLRLLSWNVEGLNSPVKRKKILAHLATLKPDVVFLQETHWSSPDNHLRSPWIGYQTSAPFTNKKRGTAILLNKSLPFTVLDEVNDPQGRFTIVMMSVLGETYLLVNVYAPHPPHLQFFSDLYATLLQYTFTHCIIGGDFNAVLDPVLDRSRVGTSSASLRASVGPLFLKDHLALFDAWRYINPEGRDYSFYSHPHDSFSRIDMFLLSSSCYHSVVDATIGMIHISDHAPVTLDLQLKMPLPRSRNWRFPTSLLHSSDFKAHLELS